MQKVLRPVCVCFPTEAGRDNDKCWKIADELCKQQQDAASVLFFLEICKSVCFRHLTRRWKLSNFCEHEMSVIANLAPSCG